MPHHVRTPRRIRQRVRLLFVNTQERAALTALGLTSYTQWIAEATGLDTDQIVTVDVADGQPLPGTIDADAIIGGGSGHSAYESLPWIARVKEFYRAAARAGVPELHICWSHQARAESVGGRAAIGGHGRRFGVDTVRLTPAGRLDPIFAGLPDEFDLFTSHVDVVDQLPAQSAEGGAVVELAYSRVYRNEALAIGPTVRTIQAHPEITATIVAALARSRRGALVREGRIGPADADLDGLIADLYAREAQIVATSRRLVRNWLRHHVRPGGRDVTPAESTATRGAAGAGPSATIGGADVPAAVGAGLPATVGGGVL
ncbi:type 1 glutamine amidotransferase [Micromonospora sp. LOL_023]|uniref:type 1 glutamine amidotransferase n=1 Tax=Micromonospora sp. LOL_023 TaxID=3345418 RepID=UPI003A83F0C1